MACGKINDFSLTGIPKGEEVITLPFVEEDYIFKNSRFDVMCIFETNALNRTSDTTSRMYTEKYY